MTFSDACRWFCLRPREVILRAHREYLTPLQVQRELGLSAEDVVQLISSGRLPAFRILGQLRIERILLERLIDELYEESVTQPIHNAVEHSPEESTSAPVNHDRIATTEYDGIPESGSMRCSELSTEELTDHQQRILWLVAQGFSNAEIATQLSLELSTVKSHISRILQRCRSRNREQLIVLAWRSGFVCENRHSST